MLSKEQKSKNMKAIKNKNSKIELLLRRSLWHRGYRYRKNYIKLIGKPDIVFLKEKIAIFCDSEFWHGYDWDNKQIEIKSNREFWTNKIEKNIQRDRFVTEKLNEDGWTVLRFWGQEIKKDIYTCLEKIEKEIKRKRG